MTSSPYGVAVRELLQLDGMRGASVLAGDAVARATIDTHIFYR